MLHNDIENRNGNKIKKNPQKFKPWTETEKGGLTTIIENHALFFCFVTICDTFESWRFCDTLKWGTGDNENIIFKKGVTEVRTELFLDSNQDSQHEHSSC